MDPYKLKAIKEWQAPTTKQETRQFLGFAGIYREFIKNFSRIVKPLTMLMRKDRKWTWGPEYQWAFKFLQQEFMKEPVLARPDYNKRFVVETDTSDQAIGAILSQMQDNGKLHPVTYYSHMLNSAERNYDTPKKELLVVVKTFKHWHHHLLGVTQPTIVLTDQANL